MWGIISCDGSFLDTVLYLDALEVPSHLSQTCRNDATKIPKLCASWSPVLRMMWHGSIDVALFVGVAETKNAPMVAATLQPMPVKAVAAWRIFGGGSGETFLDGKMKCRHGVGSSQSTCIFWRWREFHRNRKHSRSTITWCCMLSWCFHGYLRWVSLIMNRHTSAYITWTSLMVRLKI